MWQVRQEWRKSRSKITNGAAEDGEQRGEAARENAVGKSSHCAMRRALKQTLKGIASVWLAMGRALIVQRQMEPGQEKGIECEGGRAAVPSCCHRAGAAGRRGQSTSLCMACLPGPAPSRVRAGSSAWTQAAATAARARLRRVVVTAALAAAAAGAAAAGRLQPVWQRHRRLQRDASTARLALQDKTGKTSRWAGGRRYGRHAARIAPNTCQAHDSSQSVHRLLHPPLPPRNRSACPADPEPRKHGRQAAARPARLQRTHRSNAHARTHNNNTITTPCLNTRAPHDPSSRTAPQAVPARPRRQTSTWPG